MLNSCKWYSRTGMSNSRENWCRIRAEVDPKHREFLKIDKIDIILLSIFLIKISIILSNHHHWIRNFPFYKKMVKKYKLNPT